MSSIVGTAGSSVSPVSDDDNAWWFDLTSKSAVQGAKVDSKATDRLGPYGSKEEAEQALDKVEERNAAWDSDDDWGED